MSAWATLGIDPTADVRTIKRAYGRKLKVTRPEDDPQAFQELNDAYQTALQMAPHIDADEVDMLSEVPLVETAAEISAPVPMPVLQDAAHAEGQEEHEAAWERPVAALREEAWERPVPLLREIPDENALRLARQRQLEHEREQARAASRAAFELAGELWGRFLENAALAPKYQLGLALESEALLNLEVREHFELFAVQFCAGAACSDELREAIFTTFGWEEDAAFVAHRLPDATGEAMARLRAGRDYNALLQRANTEPAIAALLADSAGHRFGRTIMGNFTRQMRKEIALIREYHRELLYFKLNAEVVEEWARRVEGRRYFLETFLLSVAIGVSPFPIVSTFGEAAGLSFDPLLLLLFLPLTLAAGLAWAHFEPLARLRNADWAIDLWHDLRYQPRWQLGWIPVFALLSALMFIPDPAPAFAWLLGAAMVGCTVVATRANSVLFDKEHYVACALAALMLGGAMASRGYPGYGYLTCAVGAYCGLQLLYRGGADLWRRMPNRAGLLLPLRCVWLAGAVVLMFGADLSPLPLQLHAALCWLWALGGMLLSNPTINPFAAMGVALGLVFASLTARSETSRLYTSPLSMLIAPVFGVATFMIVNMIRTKKNQHPFS